MSSLGGSKPSRSAGSASMLTETVRRSVQAANFKANIGSPGAKGFYGSGVSVVSLVAGNAAVFTQARVNNIVFIPDLEIVIPPTPSNVIIPEVGSSGGALGVPSTPAMLIGSSRATTTTVMYDIDVNNTGNIYSIIQPDNLSIVNFPFREFVSLSTSPSVYNLSTWGTISGDSSNRTPLLIVKHTSSGIPILVNTVQDALVTTWAPSIGGFDRSNNMYININPRSSRRNVSFTEYTSGGGNGTSISTSIVATSISDGARTTSGQRIFMTKYNSSDSFQWAASISGIDLFTRFKGSLIDASGNTYGRVLHYFTCNAAVTPIQFDNFSSITNGILQYTTYARDTIALSSNIFMYKLNTNGQFDWVTRIRRSTVCGSIIEGSTMAFNSNQSKLYAVFTRGGDSGITIESSPVVLNGVLNYTVSRELLSASMYLVAFNTSGNPEWVASMQGTPGVASVVTDTNNNIYIAGSTPLSNLSLVLNSAGPSFTVSQYGIIQGVSNTCGTQLFIAKLNSNGEFQRASTVTISISGNVVGSINRIVCDKQNNIYAAFSMNADTVPNGITFRTFNSTTNGIVNTDVFGRTDSLSDFDAFFVKYDTSLNIQWIVRHDTSNGVRGLGNVGYRDEGTQIALDPTRSNSVIFGGNFGGRRDKPLIMRNYNGVVNGIIQFTNGPTLSSTSLSGTEQSTNTINNYYWVRYE